MTTLIYNKVSNSQQISDKYILMEMCMNANYMYNLSKRIVIIMRTVSFQANPIVGCVHVYMDEQFGPRRMFFMELKQMELIHNVFSLHCTALHNSTIVHGLSCKCAHSESTRIGAIEMESKHCSMSTSQLHKKNMAWRRTSEVLPLPDTVRCHCVRI